VHLVPGPTPHTASSLLSLCSRYALTKASTCNSGMVTGSKDRRPLRSALDRIAGTPGPRRTPAAHLQTKHSGMWRIACHVDADGPDCMTTTLAWKSARYLLHIRQGAQRLHAGHGRMVQRRPPCRTRVQQQRQAADVACRHHRTTVLQSSPCYGG
jgi:hypothetical protein